MQVNNAGVFVFEASIMAIMFSSFDKIFSKIWIAARLFSNRLQLEYLFIKSSKVAFTIKHSFYSKNGVNQPLSFHPYEPPLSLLFDKTVLTFALLVKSFNHCKTIGVKYPDMTKLWWNHHLPSFVNVSPFASLLDCS